ncbi:hypothetical protein B7489_15505 [Vibrio alginolyticus]|nr:hypothetical protein B7489_15505 [Vibrio alginolyticus]
MNEFTTSKRIGSALKHFVVAFQLHRKHLFAILLLFSFTEKTRVKKTPSYYLFEPTLWLCSTK